MIKSRSTKIGDWFIVCICVILILVCILPLINILARSLSSADALIKNRVSLWPVELSFNAYRSVLVDGKFTRSLGWTAILTLLCTVISMVMTIACAYPLIYENLKGKKFINGFIIFTMYFNAGVIPNYLLFKDLGLLDNPLVLMLPSCLSVFNMIIMRSFLYGVPDSLRESAEIDGAGPITILVRIYLPLSTPVLATLSLFYAVGRWNGFTDALMYMINAREYHPVQLLLYNIINSVTSVESSMQDVGAGPGRGETIKAASVMFATVPILLVYPWLQKYFVAGATLGAVKG